MTQPNLVSEITNASNVEFKYADYNVFRKAREVLSEHKQKYNITHREEAVVRHLYNFGAPKWTAEKLSKKFGVTVARIYQIKQAALKKLRHPKVVERLITGKPAPRPANDFDTLTVRTRNCLYGGQIYTLADLQAVWDKNPNELLKLPNLGHRSFNELKDWMAQRTPKAEVKAEVKAEPVPEPKKPTIANEILEGVVHTLKEARKTSAHTKRIDNELVRAFSGVRHDIQSLTARIIKLETAIEKTDKRAINAGIAPLDDVMITTLAEGTPLTPAAFKELARMVEKALGVK